ncbi:HAD family phosphatase [Lentzea sp. NPDC051838]|uniref:HAD family hydrolase n=1 Tax=Lentzea sp. NPDC051838 TaxID=3154849 RepID=UPI00343F578A
MDFGGVLTTDMFAALQSFCRREGLPDDAFAPLISTSGGTALVHDVERGRISQADFEVEAGALLGLDPEGLTSRVAADLHPEPAVLAVVDRIRARGVRVGVLSNSWGSAPFDPYIGWDLPGHFDAVVVSDQVGLRKPDPAIYRLAADRIGVPPDRCAFFDDIASYLEPARELGMTTVHATHPATTVAALEHLFGLAP